MMIARARRSRSWRSGSATEVWCRMCSCFIGLLHLLILLEEPENGETGLSPHLPLQLLHLCLDYQVNRFMGCDCHIDSADRCLVLNVLLITVRMASGLPVTLGTDYQLLLISRPLGGPGADQTHVRDAVLLSQWVGELPGR